MHSLVQLLFFFLVARLLDEEAAHCSEPGASPASCSSSHSEQPCRASPWLTWVRLEHNRQFPAQAAGISPAPWGLALPPKRCSHGTGPLTPPTRASRSQWEQELVNKCPSSRPPVGQSQAFSEAPTWVAYLLIYVFGNSFSLLPISFLLPGTTFPINDQLLGEPKLTHV